MCKVHLGYDCCEELYVTFNISTINLNTSFKHHTIVNTNTCTTPTSQVKIY